MFVITHAANIVTLGGRQGRRFPPNPTVPSCSYQPFLCPLGNPLLLKLRDGREDMEHQPPGRRSGVNVLGQRPEASAVGLDCVHDIEKITLGTGKAVVLGDGNHIALAQLIEQAVQFGPAARRAGDLVSEDPFGPRRFQGVELAVQLWSCVLTRA